MVGFCEHSNEPSGSIKARNFLLTDMMHHKNTMPKTQQEPKNGS
jgi:hypothetical protein